MTYMYGEEAHEAMMLADLDDGFLSTLGGLLMQFSLIFQSMPTQHKEAS